MKSVRIIQQALPHAVDRPGSRWWMRDESFEPVIDTAMRVIDDHAAPGDVHAAVLKQSDQRFVFTVPTGESPALVKLYRLNKLRHRLKHHRFGQDEAANLLAADDLGISCPRVYAYGQMAPGRLGCRATAVLMEYLPHRRTVADLLRQAPGDEEHVARVMNDTIDLFESLHRAACNHIDVNPATVLLSTNGSVPAALIDFQHAAFLDRPNDEVLMFEAAHFAGSCAEIVGRAPAVKWMHTMLNRLVGNDPVRRRRMHGRFEYYYGRRLSRKERMTIR